MTWVAVDAAGRDLATGRAPRWPGRPGPAAALAAAPVATWPLAVVGDDGRRLSLAAALGPGGEAVERLLDSLAVMPHGGSGLGAMGGPAGAVPKPEAPRGVDAGLGADGCAGADAGLDALAALAAATPAGPVGLPLAVVDLAAGVAASSTVDPAWLTEVERRRSAPRHQLEVTGRGGGMEAALHVALLLAAERLDPPDDADVDAHVASGARLWLLAGAVVSALAGAAPDPFAAWARLIAAGWWPVGPSGGRLVVSSPARCGSPPTTAAGTGAHR